LAGEAFDLTVRTQWALQVLVLTPESGTCWPGLPGLSSEQRFCSNTQETGHLALCTSQTSLLAEPVWQNPETVSGFLNIGSFPEPCPGRGAPTQDT
jgi:hypothetical protein